ncbi:MAG: hypothetical protein ACPHK8_03035 [Thermoplasmatota archaeon]
MAKNPFFLLFLLLIVLFSGCVEESPGRYMAAPLEEADFHQFRGEIDGWYAMIELIPRIMTFDEVEFLGDAASFYNPLSDSEVIGLKLAFLNQSQEVGHLILDSASLSPIAAYTAEHKEYYSWTPENFALSGIGGFIPLQASVQHPQLPPAFQNESGYFMNASFDGEEIVIGGKFNVTPGVMIADQSFTGDFELTWLGEKIALSGELTTVGRLPTFPGAHPKSDGLPVTIERAIEDAKNCTWINCDVILQDWLEGHPDAFVYRAQFEPSAGGLEMHVWRIMMFDEASKSQMGFLVGYLPAEPEPMLVAHGQDSHSMLYETGERDERVQEEFASIADVFEKCAAMSEDPIVVYRRVPDFVENSYGGVQQTSMSEIRCEGEFKIYAETGGLKRVSLG